MPHATPNRGAGSDGGFSPRPRFADESDRPISTRKIKCFFRAVQWPINRRFARYSWILAVEQTHFGVSHELEIQMGATRLPR